MLKWAASFAINRLLVLAFIVLAMNSLSRTNCRVGTSVIDQFEQALSGLKDISRALD